MATLSARKFKDFFRWRFIKKRQRQGKFSAVVLTQQLPTASPSPPRRRRASTPPSCRSSSSEENFGQLELSPISEQMSSLSLHSAALDDQDGCLDLSGFRKADWRDRGRPRLAARSVFSRR